MLKESFNKAGTKLIGGFLLVALLCVFVGYEGLSAMSNMDKNITEVSENNVPSLMSLGAIDRGLANLKRLENLSLAARLSGDEALYPKTVGEADKFKSAFEKGKGIYEKLPHTPEEAKLWKEFVGHANAYLQANQESISALDRGDIKLAQQVILGKGREAYLQSSNLLTQLNDIQEQQTEANNKASDAAYKSAQFTVWVFMALAFFVALGIGIFSTISLTRPLKQIGERVEKLRRLCVTNLGKANEALARGDFNFKIETGTELLEMKSKDEIGMLANSIDGIIKQTQATVASFEQARLILRDAIDETKSLTYSALEGRLGARSDADKYEGGYRELIEGVNQTLDAVVTPIKEAAIVLEQVASASDQITSCSQTLAQGACEQASTLEEVSANFHQMTLNSRQNAHNANAARMLTEQARTSAAQGVDGMMQLSAAINQIKVSADSTAKIVKTIDEIAFQTNMLALNAAVEAARAGDAGKGFAIVAEEVRNLARRSAEAAKQTANLIEESVKNAVGGVQLNQEVISKLEGINEQVKEISEVMTQIAAASEQQNQGIEQVNSAVEQLNLVTQQNAANAEESASAAEELSRQSAQMLQMLSNFQFREEDSSKGPAASNRLRAKGGAMMMSKPGASSKSVAKKRANGNGNSSTVDPSKLIPFNDDDHDLLQSF